MANIAPSCAPSCAPAGTDASSAAPGAESDMSMLQRLAQLGMRMAELILEITCLEHQLGKSATAPTPTPTFRPKPNDPGWAFNRIARTIRETLALKNRLAAGSTAETTHPRPAPKAAPQPPGTKPQPNAAPIDTAEICKAASTPARAAVSPEETLNRLRASTKANAPFCLTRANRPLPAPGRKEEWRNSAYPLPAT